MITYSHPHTFVFSCISFWASKGWKIQVKTFFGQLVLGLPDGTSVHQQAHPMEALILLCQEWHAKQTGLKFAYAPNLGFEPGFLEQERAKQPTPKQVKVDHIDAEYQAMVNEVWRQMGVPPDLFTDHFSQTEAVYKGKKIKIPKMSTACHDVKIKIDPCC